MYQPWKFLVYIAADNNLYNDAQVSLREITDASLFSDVEIVVQIDGPSAELASRYICAGGSKTLIWEAPENYTDDRAIRLTDFLNGAAGNCKANQRIFLVLWGEGAGVDHVYLYSDKQDDTTDDTGQQTGENGSQNQSVQSPAADDPNRLSIATRAIAGVTNDVLNGGNANRYVKDVQLGSILLEFSKKLGKPIDILGFDACLMALAEICYEVRSSVSIIVGSDEELPEASWPYKLILQDLARFPGMDSSTLSTLIVNRFIEKYDDPDDSTRVSLTTMKLSASNELAAAMRRLVDAFKTVVDDVASERRILRARDASRSADETSYVDLGVFCGELVESFRDSPMVHDSAKTILFVLKNLSHILYHRDSGEDGSINPYGLGLYFPDVLPPDAAGLAAAEATYTLRTYGALDGKKDPPHSKKDPPHSKKDPPHSKKDPPHSKKDPPHSKKDPGGAGSNTGTITSYHILWDSYIELQFNKETGWANFVANLLADESDQAPPNSEKAAQ
jgi:hypothetical protein